MRIVRNVLVVILGLFIGSLINMSIIMQGTSIIPLPKGIDPANVESIKAGMHLYQPKHFLVPFLAHALGTLAGAFVAARFSASKHFILAMVVGSFFLLGGISMVFSLPAPVWFSITDIVLAYIPMAYLGWKLSGKGK